MSNSTKPTAPTLSRAPATVVVTQHVRPGYEQRYLQWQHNVSRECAACPGFLGSEFRRGEDNTDEWTVIYRFDSATHLNSWLDSTVRHEYLQGSDLLFQRQPTSEVLGAADDEDSVTAVVSHPVRPEHQVQFLDWQQRITEAQQRSSGFRGSELIPPVPGSQDSWTAICRFDSTETLQGWLDSDERAMLLQQVPQFRNFDLRVVNGSFGSWFSEPSEGSTPKSWKTALSVLVGLYPTVFLLTLAMAEAWKGAKLWGSLLPGNILSVAVLTWVVMPLLTRALGSWLSPGPDAPQPRTDVIGTIASVAVIGTSALVFWFVSVAAWTLP